MCDEFFMTGTAAEVTPIRSLDQRVIGEEARPDNQGPAGVLLRGRPRERPEYHHWLTPVN